MADITISDLELAPALADDMVLAVENTTDTYAATLAMLRRLINKTFVEVENADFNALIDDGFYQCTGTPTNSPVAGAINWTLQVSAESGVVIQRAFSLDDNFANLYIRRWNGVTWTGWLEVGAGALANKANINLDNLSATGEAKITGVLPTGLILPYGGSTVPTGWLLCNGGSISRTTYENLFAVIGTSYGAGDGSTTFNLPDYTNRVPQGLGNGYLSAGLPNILGKFVVGNVQAPPINPLGQGSFKDHGISGGTQGASWIAAGTYYDFNASWSSGVYGASTTVQPPATKSNFIIKY